ncbi:ran-binding protein 3 isoform X1 [Drosophila sechellia]|uniref:GM23544 n=1 Tax=Drosophila sechellia TaxID=7238 RepID=B4HFX9_DROSE|nr:ran-binding protein 3 isoform X1 [Drosophila sechellia]EDW43372.1 GM23544 [Drosophila sechellia]
MSENNEASVETNCFRGGFTLKASRLGGAVLRPAVLANSSGSNNSSTSPSEGEDSALQNNPFLRESKDEDDDEEVVATGSAAAESTGDKEDDEVDERPDPLTKLRSNGIERSSMFAAAKNNMPNVQSSGFVFGQNVHERVVAPNAEQVNAEPDADTAASSVSAQEAASSSTAATSSSASLLFSSVIQNAAQTPETSEAAASSSICSSSSNNKESAEAKSLTDVAREYEESRAQKRKYEEVETFTGEEDEINIIDVSCKLFAFLNSNWEERGRGSLRLNDAKDGRGNSRVVFRTSGNLRLLLNTKVWAAMVAERASQKSLRLTAIDNSGVVKIFLAMGRPADIAQLHKALSERIAKRKASHPEECSVEEAKNGVASEAAASLQPESTTHDDDDEDAAPGPSGAISAEADSYGPSPKKVIVQPDSSADVPVPPVEQGDEDAEAEAKESTDQN